MKTARSGSSSGAAAIIRGTAALTLLLATPAAAARTALGSFGSWASFRDDMPPRCFAIAEPVRSGGGKWHPFATVATWPQANVRGQFYARLGRERRVNAPVTLIIDDRKFQLVAGGADTWAPDARTDAAIVAAMRSARSMSIASVSATGGGFAETYVLKGAATAIDAAALGCGRR